ncbi:SdpI family protein [Sanguibacter antarcticus]|uniref:SdpI family protein n=1 Tax=Sanguibacter antarcticus TaxID=372484 RepID=UPI0014756CD1|nr:SdpI family protein [Sanguibacter antarcticus]
MIVIQASRGERSYLAGIRLPALMKSDGAWRSGHTAARKALVPFAWAGIGIAVVSIPFQVIPVVYVCLLGLWLVLTILSLAVVSVVAVRAAKAGYEVFSPES